MSTPQLSSELINTSSNTIDAIPPKFKLNSISWHSTIGAVASDTVTVAKQNAVLLLISVTETITGLAPTLSQSNVEKSTEISEIPQGSKTPKIRSLGEIETNPFASKSTLIS